MKTPKQLTPKFNQKSTPNSEGKIKKSNKKKPALSSPKTPGKGTPNSAGKIKEKVIQKTPKPIEKSPQSNGQTPAKKGRKTPKLDGKVKNAIASEEVAKTPAKSNAFANNTQNATVSVKKQKKSPQLQKVSQVQKRKESPNMESESTPLKQAKTSPDSKGEKVNKPRSLSKRLESRKLRKERHQQILNRLKEGDQTVAEDVEKFKAKLAELQSRQKSSKNALRMIRKYKRYLSMVNAMQSGDKSDSNLNKSALEHLKNMKKTKSKQQPNEKASANAKTNSPKGNQSKCEIFVTNLPYEIQTEEIAEHFKQAGEVVKVTVPLGREKKGIAYVLFENEEICQKALALNQTVLNGRKINVMIKGSPGGFKKSQKRT